MANLIVRNIDDQIVRALKTMAGKKGISAEAMHRRILELALVSPRKRTFTETLLAIPDTGEDADFERAQIDGSPDVFD